MKQIHKDIKEGGISEEDAGNREKFGAKIAAVKDMPVGKQKNKQKGVFIKSGNKSESGIVGRFA